MSKKLFYYGSTASYTNQFIQFGGVDESLDPVAVGVGNNYLNPFSFSCYFNSSSLATETALIQTGQNLSQRFLVRLLHKTSGAIEFRLTKVAVSSFAGITTNSTFGTGTWRHVAATYSGSGTAAGMKLYINGALAATTVTNNSAHNSPTSGDDAHIASVDGVGNFFSGGMDEIALWTVELNAAQVLEDYNGGCRYDKNTHSQAANLRQWWKVEGSTYPTINGDGVGATNATMINMEAGDIQTVSSCY